MIDLTRRQLLVAAAATAITSSITRSRTSPATPWTGDATALAADVGAGRVSAQAAVDRAIAAVRALNPRLNFLMTDDFARARQKARSGGQAGPFAGVPFFVKDNHDYKGLPTRSGSRANLHRPALDHQDAYADALDAAGFIVIGKTTLPEYGLLPTTEPLLSGRTRNPWNPGRSSGGSSGGSAVAVAAGVVTIAHANDGGGSIRIPASACGLFGLKPSQGRMKGSTLEEGAFLNIGVEHCVSRSVRDSAALFAATERKDPRAPHAPLGMVSEPGKRRLRIGLLVEGYGGSAPDREIAAALRSAESLVRTLGHKVARTHWPFDTAAFSRDMKTFWCGLGMLTEDGLKDPARVALLEPFTRALAKAGRDAPADALPGAIGRLKALRDPYAHWFKEFDVILSPVMASLPAPLGRFDGRHGLDPFFAGLLRYAGYTALHNVTLAPAMSVPLAWSAGGLPIGMQFAAAVGDERTLFELAYELERAHPWAWRRPPVHAAAI